MNVRLTACGDILFELTDEIVRIVLESLPVFLRFEDVISVFVAQTKFSGTWFRFVLIRHQDDVHSIEDQRVKFRGILEFQHCLLTLEKVRLPIMSKGKTCISAYPNVSFDQCDRTETVKHRHLFCRFCALTRRSLTR